ncbi:MAG TPA: hypothetical protein VJR05_05570, partial [Acidimicrobiia bacterium]|nr:hypothetical protein [Acidimicrobiia bacterium]
MPTSFRRPPVPETPEYWDRLESELRRQADRRARRNPRTRTVARFIRLTRALARPALHGAMILIAVIIVGSMVRTPELPSSEPGSEEVRLSNWVPVVQVEDPTPSLVMHAITEQAARFVTFVVTPSQEFTP